jgi:hypothetical protein
MILESRVAQVLFITKELPPMKNFLTWFFELLNKIGTQRRYQVAFGLCLGGALMMFGSHLFEQYKIGPHPVWTVLLEVGIACIIAAIAEFILLKHASEIFQQVVMQDIKILQQASDTFKEEVKEDMKNLERANDTFRQEVRQNMKILSHCLEHQLVDIMPPRNEEQERLAVQEINSAIETARGEIRIIVFTLRDILNARTSLDGPLTHLLRRDTDVKVKLLLVDPTSNAAHIRVMAEEGPETRFEDSKLHRALRTTFYAIQELIENAKKKNRFRIEALFYDMLPNFYMVSTPNEVFIEPYHLGGRETGEDPTIGGIVPLFRFSSKSPMYESAQLHFSYIWGTPKNGNPGSNGDPHPAGYIRVKTMDEVSREIERRLGQSERRVQNAQVSNDRRAGDRRNGSGLKARTATP